MPDNTYAIERAREIFNTAVESGELTLWQSDLRRLSRLTEDSALIAVLDNPETSIDDSVKAISERLVEASPGVIRLISELLAKGRITALGDISDEYQHLLDMQRGIEGTGTAEITTAISLSNEEIQKIAGRLTGIIGKPVVIKTRVDPAIIGGIVIKIGDKLIDGSIRSKLNALKKEIGETLK